MNSFCDFKKYKSALYLYLWIFLIIITFGIFIPFAIHLYYKHFINHSFVDGKKLIYTGTKIGIIKSILNGLFLFFLLFLLLQRIYPFVDKKFKNVISFGLITTLLFTMTVLRFVNYYIVKNTHFINSPIKESFYSSSIIRMALCKGLIAIINFISTLFFCRITSIINEIYDDSRKNIDYIKLEYRLNNKRKLVLYTLFDILKIILTLGLLFPYVIVDIKYYLISQNHIKRKGAVKKLTIS